MYSQELRINLAIKQQEDGKWTIDASYDYKDKEGEEAHFAESKERDHQMWRDVDYDEEVSYESQGVANVLREANHFLDTQIERMFTNMA